ncbi:EAL domain-containing protein [Sulfurimonas sp.]|jgi:EAL and modified HD-GYP domain-containing signal transduction protein|uniref:EAL and HDOD domain-containing protein n=1 Tax=Sulfurimonas sp. TaxID=2022749 RepID=UPI002A363C1A|nr:EAL domain-containing protein [Sulfurimonas sp.]MDY0122739.1 EAL domain-containing protein [Sulfurimonas sp.]
MQNLYFARQPILNREARVDFYEVLRAQKSQEAGNGFIFESSLLEALQKIGRQSVLGKRRAFIKVDENLLMGAKIYTLSHEFFIFALTSDIEIREDVIKRVRDLNEKGFILAIDDFAPSAASMSKYSKIVDEVSFVKIDFNRTVLVNEESKEMVARVKERGVSVVATNVSDKLRYGFAKSLGCLFFQGYYFSKAKMFEEDQCKPPRLNILKLYSLLANDADFEVIVNEFKKNSSVSILLLKYINSGAFHFKNKISSIHHILTLVGREPLSKWLMLVIYSMANVPNPKTSPLMLMVKNRTVMMERILKEAVPDAGKSMMDQAYFVGVLSLIDVLFEDDMQKILDEMNVYDVVRDAILKDSGILGEIYALIRDIEEFNPKAMMEFEERHDLESGVLGKIMIECMKEVAVFEVALSSIEG